MSNPFFFGRDKFTVFLNSLSYDQQINLLIMIYRNADSTLTKDKAWTKATVAYTDVDIRNLFQHALGPKTVVY